MCWLWSNVQISLTCSYQWAGGIHQVQCRWECSFLYRTSPCTCCCYTSWLNWNSCFCCYNWNVWCCLPLYKLSNDILASDFLAIISTLKCLSTWIDIIQHSCFLSTVSSTPAHCTNQISCKATVEMIGSSCNECLCLLTAVLICEAFTEQSIIYPTFVFSNRMRTELKLQREWEYVIVILVILQWAHCSCQRFVCDFSVF